ncbi:MAG: 50S ribosomal protein L21 [Bacteroidales bacterium]|nr:50S ribosomal protein L21 [Bacteroidales bacterium]
MYAIVDIAGQQVKVSKAQKVIVHRLDAEKGSEMRFNKVLLFEKEGKTLVGTPILEGISVRATVIEHLRGEKITVFKKKRRKGYQVSNGHRQYLSKIIIEDIEMGEAGAEKEKKHSARKTSARKTAAKDESAPLTGKAAEEEQNAASTPADESRKEEEPQNPDEETGTVKAEE